MLRQLLSPMLGATLSDYLHLQDDIINYRLCPSELNALLHQLASQYNPAVADNNVNGFHLVSSHNKTFVICPMSKDAENESNESNLPHVWDVIRRFYETTIASPNDNITLLLPLRFCRGYLKLPPRLELFKRKHAVLLEVDIQAKRLQLHDSQDSLRWSCYPDKLTEKLTVLNQITGSDFHFNPTQDYHTYNTQADDYSCGYFIHAFVESILENGSSIHCDAVRLTITHDYANKFEFLKDHDVCLREQEQDDEDLDEWVNVENSEEAVGEDDGQAMSPMDDFVFISKSVSLAASPDSLFGGSNSQTVKVDSQASSCADLPDEEKVVARI